MATFEDQLKQLEQVVDRLERGDLSLEESLVLFEQGTALSEACKTELEAAEGRIQVLLQQPGRGKGMAAQDLSLRDEGGR
jgi:exodeoxyribonuclease VII small subunit